MIIVDIEVLLNGKRKVWFIKNQTCQSKQAYLSMAQRELYSLSNMIVLKGVMQRLNVKIKSRGMKADKKSLHYQLKLWLI